jgi:hypothetical protein
LISKECVFKPKINKSKNMNAFNEVDEGPIGIYTDSKTKKLEIRKKSKSKERFDSLFRDAKRRQEGQIKIKENFVVD